MQETETNSPAFASSSFASVVASLTKAARSADSPLAPAPNEDALADDRFTLSYEQALRTHARYHPSVEILPDARCGAGEEEQPIKPDSASGSEDINGQASTKSRSAVARPAVTADRRETVEKSRKASSITIRLSEADCSQLRTRAIEAGLTVSAYLRSCVFEVETLRAQVKDALAQLRQAAPVVEPAKANLEPASAHSGWRSRIFAHLRLGDRTHA